MGTKIKGLEDLTIFLVFRMVAACRRIWVPGRKLVKMNIYGYIFQNERDSPLIRAANDFLVVEQFFYLILPVVYHLCVF